MKLIFIYGPPAVGKLTVARELSKITGFKIFHNHLTVDLISSIFDFDHPIAEKLRAKYRLELIEIAAKEKIKGLIFTFVYFKREDDAFLEKIIHRVEKYGGEVFFVQLICQPDELFRRIKHPSRKQFGKIKKIKILKEKMKAHDTLSSFGHKHDLTIDNTNLSPQKTAKKIKEHYKL